MQDGRFALIYENEVKNIFICENYELANQLARASFGDEAFAVETTRYASGIGNKYENGIFYKILEDGTKKQIEYIPTAEDKIIELQSKLDNSQSISISQYENNLILESKINDLTKTLTTFYEKMEEIK